MTVPDVIVEALRAAVGPTHVLDDDGLRAPYEVDWTGRYRGRAALVVRPGTTEEVAAVLGICSGDGLAVVPQGGNTGLVAGGVPLHGEVVLSLRRLDHLDPVDRLDAQVTVGAGVTLAGLQRHADAAGLAFAVDLAARDSATIGGMVATNAGGTRAFRHGDMRRQVTGVEAVLADGRILRHLSGLLKDNTGYHLESLLCGSEGTLAVVTAVRVRLEPRLPYHATALLATRSIDVAMEVLVHLRNEVASLDAVELMTNEGVQLVCDHLRTPSPFAEAHAAYLLVEAAHRREDPVDDLAAGLAGIAELVADEAVATDPIRREQLWRIREAHTEAINAQGQPLKLDVTLPLEHLARFVDEIPATVTALVPGARVLLFGHAADGNVHVNALGVSDEASASVTEAVLGEVVARGGSISAEHGIGTVKRAWLSLSRSPAELETFAAIRRAFDPHGILNPHALVLAEDR